MQILENAPDRLTLRNRSLLFGWTFALGAALWVVVVGGTAIWGAIVVSTRTPPPSLYWVRMFGLGVLLIFGVFFAWVGVKTALDMLRGTTCTFDRSAATVTVTQPGWPSLKQRQHSIYGVSHAHAEHNPELETTALYLVLRSGERIPLGICHTFQGEDVEVIMRSVRAFLQRT